MPKKKGMSKKEKEGFNALSSEEKAEAINAVFENIWNEKTAKATAKAVLAGESLTYDFLYQDYVEKIDKLDSDNLDEWHELVEGLLGKIRTQHLKNIVGKAKEEKNEISGLDIS